MQGLTADNGGESEKRWAFAQHKENAFWERTGVLDSQMERVVSRYGSVIEEISRSLDPDSSILDVGCGPTCAGQLFEVGVKTYLDPLLDAYMKAYPDGFPKGEKICSTAENIPKLDETFDVVLSVNALDHMIDPTRALCEIQRVLKRDGIFMLGIFLHPPPIAAARMFVEKWLPFFREEAHPHSYTRKLIKKLLNRYFTIQKEVRVFRKNTALIPSLHREDWVFICSRK